MREKSGCMSRNSVLDSNLVLPRKQIFDNQKVSRFRTVITVKVWLAIIAERGDYFPPVLSGIKGNRKLFYVASHSELNIERSYSTTCIT